MTKSRSGFAAELERWYLERFPESREQRQIGHEKELPLVWEENFQAADGRLLFPAFMAMGWQPKYDDVNSEVMLSVANGQGVELTTEAGWCTLELIMPPRESVLTAYQELAAMEKLISRVARDHGMLLLGYGIQPVTNYGRKLWIAKSRHNAIRQALPEEVNVVTITASDQVHLDISRSEIVDAVNVFNAFSGLIIQLFANSPVWQGKPDAQKRLAVREDMWRFATPDRRGMFPRQFADISDFISHMAGLKQLIVRHNGGYQVPGTSYFQYVLDNPQTDWQTHWLYLEGMTWTNARPRVPYGTIEVRPACSQAAVGSAALAAFTLGLLENLKLCQKLLSQHPWSYWQSLRRAAIRGQRQQVLWDLCGEALHLAEGGLKKRALGEEEMLGPLVQRLHQRQNQAQAITDFFPKQGMDALVAKVVL